jgi:small-conductance mechanosensitive channel/quinol monooxygenase YgiN
MAHTTAMASLSIARLPAGDKRGAMRYLSRPPARVAAALLRTFHVLACALALCAAASAQELPGSGTGAAPKADAPSKAAAPTAVTEAELKAKHAAAQAELERFTADSAAKAPRGASEQEVLEYRTLLGILAAAYARQLDARDELALVHRSRAALAAKVKNSAGLGPGPHPLPLVHGLRGNVQAAAEQLKAGEAKLALLDEQLARWRSQLQDLEAQARLAEERARESSAAADAARAWARDLAVLRARTLAAGLATLDMRIEIAREEVAERREALAFAERQSREAAKSVVFARSDLDAVLAQLDTEADALDREVAQAQARVTARRDELRNAQAAVAAAEAAPWRPGESPDQAARQRTRAERAAGVARVRAENANLAVDVARALADGVRGERGIWQSRYAFETDRDTAKYRETFERVDALLQRLGPWRQFAQREVTLALGQLGEQEARAAEAVLVDDRVAARDLGDAYRERAATYERLLRAIDRKEAALQRWHEEFEGFRAVRPLSFYAEDAWYAARRVARQVWDFELFTAEDTLEVDGRKITATRSVTVGKSIGAVVLLILGYVAVSWFVRRLERHLVTRFKADVNVARITRRWVQVMLVAVLFVIALDVVRIPLTVFAFLGGALAIAFGFGAQNLMKNLMSGIMLLVERPLKIGDLVQIGGTVGTVTNISIRSSTIRTGDGIETLVPNSALVENNVTNWTHSSSEVRQSVQVSVAYGSDTRKVSDTLLAQAERHGQILKQPAPRVLFQDFGADGLVFALQYWIDFARGVDGTQIASDLRFMTEKALAEAGIAVPFPQRDLHLGVTGPVQVEMLARAEPQLVARQSRG